MAAISVGGAVTSGFSLIRREPAAVAIWAVLLFAFFALRILANLPVYRAFMGQLGHGGTPNMQALLPQIQQAQALGLLLSIGSLALNTMLACAIFRAVLHPEQRGFAYLKFGAAELFLFIFTIGVAIAFFIALLVVMIPVAIIVGLTASQSPATGASIAVVAGFAVLIAGIYLALRLSLLGPMMVDEGEFRFGEAWSLTRGKVGALFLIGLMLFVMAIVAEFVVGGVCIGLFVSAAGGLANMRTFFQQPGPAILASLGSVLAVGGLFFLVLIAVALPVLFAPWACAYRDLRRSDLAAAFS
ncbi:MAG TPA: hypothetical protein VHY32_12590 [Caulobacteraceae bacterium]|jgi:hypothetical protein|nr:hypothetical protein [Caulobacteraceae bacterium]